MSQVPTERQIALLNLLNTLGKLAIFHSAEHRRMNRRHDSWFLSSGSRIAAGHKNVLPVPPLDPFIVPHPPADAIGTNESALIEQGLPVGWPLAIHMVLPRLVRTCGPENNRVRMRCQGINQGGAERRIQVLGNFQTQRRIEPPSKTPWLSKVLYAEKRLRNQQLVRLDRSSVHAKNIVDAHL